MAEVPTHSEPRILAYEAQASGRNWVLIASRVVHVAGFITWAAVGVGFYDLYTDLSDSPGPFWFDATAGTVTGGIVASPIFGLALLVQRFGRHITRQCSGPARRMYFFCLRKWHERPAAH
jgi:hypothetical protein